MHPGPGGPGAEGDPMYAHMAHHEETVAQIPPTGEGCQAVPRVMITPPTAPPPPAYEARWTNLDTGEVDAERTYVIADPEYEAFQRHGGMPYQVEPQHDAGPIPLRDRIDRAMQDVERAMSLIKEGDHGLGNNPVAGEPCRDRLAQAVNLLCSAARDVDILRNELPIILVDCEAEALNQRQWMPFAPQPMFAWTAETGRVFREAGTVYTGPLTIREKLDKYWSTLCQAARDAAMALLMAAETELREVGPSPTYESHLIGATRPSWEEGHDILRELRSMIAFLDTPRDYSPPSR